MEKKPKTRCPKCKRKICIKKLVKSRLNHQFICQSCYFFENLQTQKEISQSDNIFFNGVRITSEDREKAERLVKLKNGMGELK